MPRKPSDIERVLQAKFGFSRKAVGRGEDHRWYELQLEGLQPIRTKVSHTRQDIVSKVEGKIARQLRVRKGYFDGMMDCTNSSADYQRQVRDDPYPPWNVLIVS